MLVFLYSNVMFLDENCLIRVSETDCETKIKMSRPGGSDPRSEGGLQNKQLFRVLPKADWVGEGSLNATSEAWNIHGQQNVINAPGELPELKGSGSFHMFSQTTQISVHEGQTGSPVPHIELYQEPSTWTREAFLEFRTFSKFLNLQMVLSAVI